MTGLDVNLGTFHGLPVKPKRHHVTLVVVKLMLEMPILVMVPMEPNKNVLTVNSVEIQHLKQMNSHTAMKRDRAAK